MIYFNHLNTFLFNTSTQGEMIGQLSFTLLLFLIILLGYLCFRYNRQIHTIHHSERLRSAFYTKVSYEFRTPLTVILGLTRQLQEQKDHHNHNTTTYLSAIERQGRHLTNFVDQLLDVASLNSYNKPNEWKRGNLAAYVEMIAESFSLYASQKGIELVFFCEEKEIKTAFVPGYLNKILQNLLSNAVTYSSEGSKIFLILEKSKKDKKMIILKVVDHGKGINKEELPHIFDLFYKNPTSEIPVCGGIGLALTQHLVRMLNGSISVESDEGKGTVFTIHLPLHKERKKSQLSCEADKSELLPMADKQSIKGNTIQHSGIPNENDPRTTLLLVEDNTDVALYISALFDESRYNLLYANNGVKALEIANEALPDILITDVNMPKKNGFELCREIRSSPLLNHIPVIIISARNNDTDRMEGIKCGADAYIYKPFHAIELQIRVEKLLESRNLLKEKYSRTILHNEMNEVNSTVNINFLRQATDIIHREMKNPVFSPKMLSEELAISVSQLNKKLNAVTGSPSSAYILQVKLAKAKKILASQNRTIGEVAAECGIYDVNYFSRVFKKNTGVTPTQYQRLPRG